jgi:hypothetical protein
MTLLGAPLTLKQEFYKWYCDFNFPSTEWDDLYPFKRTIQTVSHSPLCHESRAVWESAYLHKAYDGATYDDTRCAKLPRDCARKAVELINAWKANGYVGSWAPDESFRACYDCHTQLNTKKLPVGIHSGKEDCTRCHTVAASHATRTPRGPESGCSSVEARTVPRGGVARSRVERRRPSSCLPASPSGWGISGPWTYRA